MRPWLRPGRVPGNRRRVEAGAGGVGAGAGAQVAARLRVGLLLRLRPQSRPRCRVVTQVGLIGAGCSWPVLPATGPSAVRLQRLLCAAAEPADASEPPAAAAFSACWIPVPRGSNTGFSTAPHQAQHPGQAPRQQPLHGCLVPFVVTVLVVMCQLVA